MKRRLRLYSGVGIGFFFHDELNSIETCQDVTEESFNLAYQMNLIGIGGRAGFFLEGGYGYKGVMKIGINLQL